VVNSHDTTPTKPKLFGASFSVYVQALRLTLAAKSVEYDLQQENPFEPATLSPQFNAIQPFGKVPAFCDQSVRLYQADTIARYIDDNYPGPLLMPANGKGRASANQIIGILNSYAYPNWVRRLYIQRISVPAKGGTPNENLIAKALPIADLALQEIHRLGFTDRNAFLMGSEPTLPDFFCAPMFACLRDAPEGANLIGDHPKYAPWYQKMQSLPYFEAIVT